VGQIQPRHAAGPRQPGWSETGIDNRKGGLSLTDGEC
jgi:hypothetical protein